MIIIRELRDIDMRQAIELKALCWPEELGGLSNNKINIDKELGDKLIEFLKKDENLSAEKLAINLQMSKRNASRILLKLESHKLATSFFEKISRGRPVKMFKLNHKIMGETR